MSKQRSAAARVVLVTGASSGIGKAICGRFSRTSNRVYGASRTQCSPDGWTHVTMDVTDDASIGRAIDEVMRREGRIDALIGCAGVSLAGPVEDTSMEEAQQHFNTNFFGTVRVIRAVLPIMRRQGKGRIVIVGSIGGLIGLPYIAHYSASKFALDGFIEAMRPEIAPFGIEATVLHPGHFNTRLRTNRTYCNATTDQSPYYQAFQRACSFYGAAEAKGGSPEAVARKIERILSWRRLPTRAFIGSPLELMGVGGKAVLPSAVFEVMLRMAYGP